MEHFIAGLLFAVILGLVWHRMLVLSREIDAIETEIKRIDGL